ncbi:MAG: site-2 protease family protein [Nanoarchaeota archaeon]
MSFLLALLEYKAAIIFYSLVFILIYLNRKKFDVHGNFIFLYRTKFGIKLMEKIASKAGKAVKFFGYIGAVIGFIGMAAVFALILLMAYKLLMGDSKAAASPVLPGLPIAGTGLVFPLVTGWIVLFIIILIHEFSHGVVASAHKIKVKNSGIAFFGPILGAFVEPDEEGLKKRKDMVQHSVFAAGAFSNFLTVAVVMLLATIFLAPLNNILTEPTGVVVFSQPGLPAEIAGIKNNSIVTEINGKDIRTMEDFRQAMLSVNAGEKLNVAAGGNNYAVTSAASPDEPSQGYLGVWIKEERKLKHDNFLYQALLKMLTWLQQMFGWLSFLSLNIGLINLLPIFITDGARMLKIFLDRIIKDKEKSISVWAAFNWISLLSLLTLVFLPFFRWINSSLASIIF